MLQIFKTFAEESSLLEDFDFYEKREQTHETKRTTAPQPEIHWKIDSPKLKKEGKRIVGEKSSGNNEFSDSTSTLINLTFVQVHDFRRAQPDAIAHSAAKIISSLKVGGEKTMNALKSWRCKGIQAENSWCIYGHLLGRGFEEIRHFI